MARNAHGSSPQGNGISHSDLGVVLLGLDRVEQLAAQQSNWGLPEDRNVVERIRQNFGRPSQTPRRATQKDQMHGAKNDTTDAQRQPNEANVMRKAVVAARLE